MSFSICKCCTKIQTIINRNIHAVSFSSTVSTEPLGSWMLCVLVICEHDSCDLVTSSPASGLSSGVHRNVWFLLRLWGASERAGTRGAASHANTERSHVQNLNLHTKMPSVSATSLPFLKCQLSPEWQPVLQISEWWDGWSSLAAQCCC